jgi:hypothetical protein
VAKVYTVIISILISSILFLSLTGCSEDTPKEIIRVTGSESDIELITNEKDIADIRKIMESVEWMEGTLNRPNREVDYQFWLEEEGVEERLANYEVWYEDSKTIIFNSTDGKVGEIKELDAQKLKQYLIKTSN